MLIILNTPEIRSKLQELGIQLIGYRIDTDKCLLIKQDSNNVLYGYSLYNLAANITPVEDPETIGSFALLLSLGFSFQDAKQALEIDK